MVGKSAGKVVARPGRVVFRSRDEMSLHVAIERKSRIHFCLPPGGMRLRLKSIMSKAT